MGKRLDERWSTHVIAHDDRYVADEHIGSNDDYHAFHELEPRSRFWRGCKFRLRISQKQYRQRYRQLLYANLFNLSVTYSQ